MRQLKSLPNLISALLISITLITVVLSSAEAENSSRPASISPTLTEWIIMASVSSTISVVDTSSNTVHGPFLGGQLGSEGGQLLDIAVTPNGQTALASNFGDKAIYFIDISNPIHPSVIASVTTGIFAEDIAISKDGKYALVTDGGFSPEVETISIVDRTLVCTTSLGTKSAQAVDIAPDGTVVVVDFFNGAIHTMRLDSTGYLTYTNSYTPTINGYSTRPVNVGIAPDGQTVIVCQSPYTSTLSAVGIFKITAPGVLSYIGAISPFSRSTQSVAFSPGGDKAYLSGNDGISDTISILNITSPGVVTVNTENAADLFRKTSAQYFGVDTVAVANGKAYFGYPTGSIFTGTNSLSVVDLSTLNVVTVTTDASPRGVAAIPLNKIYLPIVKKAAQ